MSQENASKESSPVASLLQKTHAKMTLLQRVEEQFTALAAQRHSLQDELRTLQSEINAEMNKLIEPPSSATAFSVDANQSKKNDGRVRFQSVAA